MQKSLSTHSHLMRAYARQPISFVRGSGARLWDEQGVEYLDAIAGVAVLIEPVQGESTWQSPKCDCHTRPLLRLGSRLTKTPFPTIHAHLS